MKQFATCDDIVKTIRANCRAMDPGDLVLGWQDGPDSYAFFFGRLVRVVTVRDANGVSSSYEIETIHNGSTVGCNNALLFQGELDDGQT